MRRFLLLALVALALLLPAAPAHAVDPGTPQTTAIAAVRRCATKADYNRIRNGMTRKQVNAILRSAGTTVAYRAIPRVPYWLIFRTVKYPVCNKRTAFIIVQYLNDRVRAKSARW